MNHISDHKIIHFCDFDGTLSVSDSFLHFLRFTVPLPRLILGGLRLFFKFPVLLLSGNWSRTAGKAAVFSEFFRGRTEQEMHRLGEIFVQEKIPGLLRPALIENLRRALEKGETVVVVSASADLWLRPFCRAESFELLCTELEYTEEKFSGRFATPNCNGAEKAQRIRAAYALDSYTQKYAYGNSGGDVAMYELADKVFKF